MGLKDQIDRLLDIENSETICNEVDLAKDGIIVNGNDSDNTDTEISLDSLLSVIVKRKES